MISFTQKLFVITIVYIKFVAGSAGNLTVLDPSAGSSSFDNMYIPKCCPDGMSLSEDLASNACVNTKQDFATNYKAENTTMVLRPIDKDFCKNGTQLIMGDDPGDQLSISPNILKVDDELYTEYCIDRYNGSIIAKVCVSATSENGFSVEAKGYNNSYNLTEILFIEQIIPFFMLISVVLFFLTGFIYLIVPKLRDVHGEMLALHSIFMGVQYLLMVFNKIMVLENSRFQDVIHFFILSSLGWLLMMTIDMVYNLSSSQTAEQFQQKLMHRMTVSSFVTILLPAIFVGVSPAKYVPMHFTDNALDEIMTPIIIFILPINFLMFIPIYTFFVKDLPRCSAKLEVKHRAKSAFWIFVIIALNWFSEWISLKWPEVRQSLIAFATLNSLQGVAIVCVFVLMPHYTQIIWAWCDCRRTRNINQLDLFTI